MNSRSFLRRWARRSIKHRRRLSSIGRLPGLSLSRRLGSYHNRRALLAGFQGLSFASAVHKRQRVCLKTAVAHCFNGAGRTLFQLWWFRVRNATRRRRQSRTELMLRVFDAWRHCLVPLEKRERRVAAAVECLHDATVRRAVSTVFTCWKEQARRQVLLRTRRASLEARIAATLLRRGLSVWKSLWASFLFRRSRELTEDAARLHATGHLRRQENEELARELEALRRSGAEQERVLAELQERLVERDHAVRDAETTLEQRRQDKAALEEALQESRRLLVEAGEERKRMRAVEEALARDRAKDAAALQQRKAEAERQAAMAEAAAMIERAKSEAERVAANAAADALAQAARREKMAMDRIAAAEASAVAEVRSAAAEVATIAARSLIAETFSAEDDAAMIDQAVTELPKALRAA
jgi:F-type H+-transporting ATPase subunit b